MILFVSLQSYLSILADIDATEFVAKPDFDQNIQRLYAFANRKMTDKQFLEDKVNLHVPESENMIPALFATSERIQAMLRHGGMFDF